MRYMPLVALALVFGATVPAAAYAQGGSASGGATVVQCRDLNFPPGELKGNLVFTPSGHEGQHCRFPDAGEPSEVNGALVLRCDDVVAGLEGNIVFTPGGPSNYHCSPFNP